MTEDFTEISGTDLPATMGETQEDNTYAPLTDQQRQRLAAIIATMNVVRKPPPDKGQPPEPNVPT